MVADDDWDVAVQFPVVLPDEEVKQAVVHFADQDGHPLALRPVRYLLVIMTAR